MTVCRHTTYAEFLRRHFANVKKDSMRAAEARTKKILEARVRVSSTSTNNSSDSDAEDEEMDEEEEMMWEAYDAGLCDDDESTKETPKSPLTTTPKSAAPAPSG